MTTRLLHSTTARPAALRRGLGLLEVVVSALLVGVLLVASLDTLAMVSKNQRLNRDRLVSAQLTHELLSEVMSLPYLDPDVASSSIGLDTGESGATRADFDDVDDYDGWDLTGPQNKDGTSLADFAGWRRQVEVVWWSTTLNLPDLLTDSELKRIKVTVTSPAGDQTVRIGYRAEQGMLQQTPYVDTSAATWVGARLQLGKSSLTARVGENLINHCTDPN